MGKPTGFLEYERVEAKAVSPKERIKNFNEFHTPLSEAEQRKQSARCMDCGVPFCQSGMTIKGMTSGCPLNNLIPEWNKEMIPEIIRRIKNGTWFCNATESDVKDLLNYYSGEEIGCDLRHLGIIMACYDEDNFSLEYPIKITTMEMEYENVSPSKDDPNQGWEDDYC